MGVKDFVLRNFLILGLLTVITAGLIFPAPGLALHNTKVLTLSIPQLMVIIIFVVSGLALDSVSDAMQPKALVLGIVMVLFVTPLIAWPIIMLGEAGYIENYALVQGMALFCIVPTTLSSGVTMVTQARGNVSLAILLTTVTNLCGVVTMPWPVAKIFAATVDIHPEAMLKDLVCMTLFPLCFGMALRPLLDAFRKANKKPLGLTQNSCILVVVWLSVCGAQSKIFSTSGSDLTICALLAAGVHLVYRVGSAVVANVAQLPEREWVTIVLMCSQKSLPVCVSIMSVLPPVLQQITGLLIVPCIMAHASQLIIDSALAVRWQLPEAPKQPLLG
eukprot:gnl/TRDRNA2_/TRDRNA2_195676_c0_seq1.p1 gnl/TRDRNA2_/TRDRNA2_195676_c0~~gnl/TRDRNA2_/TRDRNA2_195676_c0_seq1.p1  ORF type:complete len:332 (-),score=52.02 gnl/TRDRNA2_/TRDRNA2_195676_c0_seq1:297-1292(-)